MTNPALVASKQISQLVWQVFDLVSDISEIAEPTGVVNEDRITYEIQLRNALEREFRLISATLEHFGLRDQLAELRVGFEKLTDKIIAYEYDGESGYWFSTTQTFLNDYLDVIRLFLPVNDSNTQMAALEILENMLRSTAVLMSKHDLVPKNETEVNRFMETFIKAAFPKALYNPSVPSVLKSYHPEFGIPELQVLIEYKFAEDEVELKAAVDGVLTDTRGYSGDAQWRFFFAVFYLTDAFSTETRVRAHFEQCGVPDSWRIIVLNGAGGRKKKNIPPVAAEVPTTTVTPIVA